MIICMYDDILLYFCYICCVKREHGGVPNYTHLMLLVVRVKQGSWRMHLTTKRSLVVRVKQGSWRMHLTKRSLSNYMHILHVRITCTPISGTHCGCEQD